MDATVITFLQSAYIAWSDKMQRRILSFVRNDLGLSQKVVKYVYTNADAPVCYGFQHTPIG